MLDELQFQLEAQFAALAKLRRPAGYPVYAIEHAVPCEKMREARKFAGVEHRTFGLLRKHWLVWVAIAAEAGYGYDGEEYWPSLETSVGQWRSAHDRQTLRAWYEKFSKEFGGPVPEGRWAQHFNIIAWPIAGAVLPRYLQGHFARHLFQIRYGLSRLADAGADEIGRYLAATGDQRSTRYEDFLEQTDLTGRIVLALRDEDLNEPVPRIVPGTLARIVGDLERRREAGDFLRSARQVLRSARGVASAQLDRTGRSSQAKTEAAVGAIRLMARQQADGSLALGVRMPNFAVAMEGLGAASTAGQMRVRLHGETNRWSPGAALFSWSGRDLPIKAFPDPGTPLIELENAPARLLPVLQPLAAFEERPTWLLRRGEDNVYRQVVGNQVRPAQAYVLVVRASPPPDLIKALGLQPAATDIRSVTTFAFRAPPTISPAYRSALQRFGLGFVLRGRVEPVGLNPVSRPEFDGPSWAAGEEVVLRLSADFQAAEFILELDNEARCRFGAVGGQTFVTLGVLPVGNHTLKVSAVARDGGPDAAIDVSPVSFEFQIFEPRSWTEVVANRAGFRVLVEPGNAPLESVLMGQATVAVYGPPGRRVSWRLDTIDASGHVAGGGPLANVRLPMQPNDFAAAIRRFKDYSEAIDAAHRVDLVAELDELGRQTVRFPHMVEPLRWTLDAGRHELRLIDETAHDEEIRVTKIDLSSPAVRRRGSHADLIAGAPLDVPGALFCAEYKGQRYVAFASLPPAERMASLSELGVTQDFRPISIESARGVIQLINALKLWRLARPIGRMAMVRKIQTLRGLESELCRIACGAPWSAALACNPAQLERAQTGVGGSPGFGSRMRTTAWSDMTWGQARAEFARCALHYQITPDHDLADRAIILAFRPGSLRIPPGLKPDAVVAELLANRILVRGAFLARAASVTTVGMLAA